ncbi:hypothetical protein Taro_049645 [Colocasia esculenta]|uniref:Carboxypeptidase n=1 Tax=Colocasia esculenta TaxID=4460 RepID=A0A843XBK5_COLES|nr:hypothetical protein [Colocasia esculenta]
MTKRSNISFFFLVVTLLFLLHGSHGSRRPRRQGHVLIKSLLDSRKPRMPVPPVADEKSTLAATAFDPSKFSPQDGLKKGDRIKALPGQPAGGVDFRQYGGYVTVDGKSGRALFYYFVEAVGPNPASKPLLLWLNGGPGCSSLGFGALEELGPFRVMSDGRTLFRNPYAWNAVANVLFLESPAGTGYSYSNTTSDYSRCSDARSAEDALVFLLNWMERFPEYKRRDFYIAGESYAGHFVTQLARCVCRHNLQQQPPNNINLKGVLMGNAVLNADTDNRGMYDYYWNHALISDDAIAGIRKFCNFSVPDLGSSESPGCNDALGQADETFRDPLDLYDIYAPICHSERVTALPKTASVDDFDPCTDYYVEAYLNLAEVQAALHANVTKLHYPWQGCSDQVGWDDKPRTVLPLIRELMQHGIRIMVYSGDVDGVIPVTSTRYSINMLKLPVKTPWQSWSCRGELGGYSIVYQGGLTLATVRGAGHEVPSYQPRRALVLLTSFLNGEPLPRPVKA